MVKAVEIVGRKVGRVVVIARAGSTSQGQSRWLCRCECGTEITRTWDTLKRNKGTSCGCDRRVTFDMKERVCLRCKVRKSLDDFPTGHKHRWKGDQWGRYCRECNNVIGLDYYRRNPESARKTARKIRLTNRTALLNHYGTVCACCGEAEPMFLCIDHVHGGGNKHRKTLPKGDGFYKWLVKNNFPPGFQTLCVNCNWGKFRNGGICPHQTKKEQAA